MARVFKRAGRARYLIDFEDTAGVTRRVLGFTDADASEELGRKIDRAVAIRQSGDILAGDMLKWLETLKPVIRDRLAKWNVIDPQRAAAEGESRNTSKSGRTCWKPKETAHNMSRKRVRGCFALWKAASGEVFRT